MLCPICEKRKPARFCPAKGEKICAVCCGTEREVSLDCPADCAYLVAAHRYEEEHPRAVAADAPFVEERLPADFVYTHQRLLGVIAFTIAKACAAQPTATDPDVLAAVRALAESYRTLISGIYYEKTPDLPVQREIYVALRDFLNEAKQKASEAGAGAPKDSEIFATLVFVFRMGLLRSNRRPRSERFIEFLRGQFPQAAELKREESKIIMP